MPADFFTGKKNYSVYLGQNAKTGRAEFVYAGITKQGVEVRELQHGGKYKLVEIRSGLTRKQARAIEELIIDNNPHFRNKIPSIGTRHKCRNAALR